MMRNLLAVLGVVASVSAFACSSAPAESDEEVGSAEGAWTGKQCKKIHQGYVACLQDTNDGYRACVQKNESELIRDVATDLAGLTLAGLPCVSAQLGALLDARCLYSSGDGSSIVACVSTTALSILNNIDAYKSFTRCAGELGAATAEGEKVLAEYTRGLEKSVYALLATEAARVTKFTVQYKLCADELESSADACEPIACNAAKCTCFDTPSCPTIARCGGTQTHMTGIVDCGSIANGKATTNQGTAVTCTSWTNQAAPGCHGKATAGACK